MRSVNQPTDLIARDRSHAQVEAAFDELDPLEELEELEELDDDPEDDEPESPEDDPPEDDPPEEDDDESDEDSDLPGFTVLLVDVLRESVR